MNPYILPWFNLYKTPFSGNVNQQISPYTNWWSPQIEFNFAGNRQIESKVVEEVASYGKQLGIVAEAILEIAEGKPGDSVTQLKELTEKIEKIKQAHAIDLEEQIKQKLNQLKQQDPKTLEKLLRSYQ